jgi:hypothetical protein
MAKTQWTILTYIAAHNNLQELGDRSLEQIVGIGSTREVVHGVLFDGEEGAVRCMVGDPGKVIEQEKLPEFDSGDPDRLIETARWVFSRYPAERYGLILWSHGSGWMPHEIEAVAEEVHGSRPVAAPEAIERSQMSGSRVLFRSSLAGILKPQKLAERAVLFDDGTGHSLDTVELGRVVASIHSFIHQPLEFLGMDACLMANIEVAYQIRNAVRFMVASEELVPGHSWPYDTIMGALRARPETGGADLARLVVEKYTAYYTAHPPAAGDVTKAALDLAQVHTLAEAVDILAAALIAGMDLQADVLWKAQSKTLKRETRQQNRTPSKFDYHLWDIGSLAAGLMAESTASAEVKHAAGQVVHALQPGNGVVLAEGHRGEWFDGIGGMTIYLMPSGKQQISQFYGATDLAKETRWADMLKAYHGQYA